MEIREIKERLSILAVLEHYGISVNRNKMVCCPFHDDKTPSMQVYAATGTVFCFSASCKLNGKAIDQIDFILHKEHLSKHEAIKKARALAGMSEPMQQATTALRAENAERIMLLSRLLEEGVENMDRSKRAQDYCRERGLDYKHTEVGYLGERFYHRWNEQLKTTAVEIGLLKVLENKNLSASLKECLVFGMRNEQNQVVNVYGRSITGKGHYYLKGRHQGLYPGYPEAGTKILIFTESIIDAASLLQIPEIKSGYSLLALYGTNGLTAEHKEAIKKLKALEEIIFLLDADDAGDKATEKYAQELKACLPKVTMSKGSLPEGEDVNSVLCGHDAAVMQHIIEKRSVLFFSESSLEEKAATAGSLESASPPSFVFDSSNREKLVYESALLKVESWGGVEYSNLHRLRVSLYLEHSKTKHSFRDEVNLYSHRSRKQFLADASEALQLTETELKGEIDQFTGAVEIYRLEEKEKRKRSERQEIRALSKAAEAAALEQLQSKDLIPSLKASMQQTGLIGEAENGLLLFLIFLTRYFDHPLHALVHGSSGSGKTNLLKSVLNLVPEESKYVTTALSENVLFRPPYPEFWKHKILLLEDLDGSYKALYPLREFMSNQHISKFVSEADPKTGQFKQVLLEASGPVCIAGATTRDKVYEDNSNRSFLLHVDESRSHQEKILDYQNLKAAGLIDEQEREELSEKIRNLQRVLDTKVKVVNPFQPSLKLPEYVFKKLRTNTHYITLIKAITFLHQYQREKRQDKSQEMYIETTLEDVALANALSKQSLLRKSDELSGQVRDFFEHVKSWVKQSGKNVFLSKDLREQFRLHPMKLKRQLDELTTRGYLRKTGGNKRISYEYEVAVWDDYQVLKDGLKVMDETLEKLWQQYPDGRYTQEKKSKNHK